MTGSLRGLAKALIDLIDHQNPAKDSIANLVAQESAKNQTDLVVQESATNQTDLVVQENELMNQEEKKALAKENFITDVRMAKEKPVAKNLLVRKRAFLRKQDNDTSL